MVDQLSPLSPAPRSRRHAGPDGVGVTLSELQPGSIVQLAAWPGAEAAMIAIIRQATGLELSERPGGGTAGGAADETKAAFGFAPGKFLAMNQDEGLAQTLAKEVHPETGTVTDLSHGRTAIRVAGPRAEWVLAKFFAIDFSEPAFPAGSGLSTVHHDIFAQIQRSGPDQFDLYVFRSFARSFWTALCRASEEVGYEVE